MGNQPPILMFQIDIQFEDGRPYYCHDIDMHVMEDKYTEEEQALFMLHVAHNFKSITQDLTPDLFGRIFITLDASDVRSLLYRCKVPPKYTPKQPPNRIDPHKIPLPQSPVASKHVGYSTCDGREEGGHN